MGPEDMYDLKIILKYFTYHKLQQNTKTFMRALAKDPTPTEDKIEID